jgi:hypothetical protein
LRQPRGPPSLFALLEGCTGEFAGVGLGSKVAVADGGESNRAEVEGVEQAPPFDCQ